jgi:hypothetical protein
VRSVQFVPTSVNAKLQAARAPAARLGAKTEKSHDIATAELLYAARKVPAGQPKSQHTGFSCGSVQTAVGPPAKVPGAHAAHGASGSVLLGA